MKLNFNSILLSSEDHKKLVEFYGKVFEKEPEMSDETYSGFLVGSCFLSIGAHDKVKGKSSNPERILLNFETDDVEGEFRRIKDIEGVKVIAEPYAPAEGFLIATFADPDGNYFQLMTPWDDDSSKVN